MLPTPVPAHELVAGRATAERLFEGGNPAQAQELLVALRIAHGDDPALLSDLAVVSFHLGSPEYSFALLDRALEVDRTAQDAAENHGQLLQALTDDPDQRSIVQRHAVVCTWRPAASDASRRSQPLRLNLGAGDDRRDGYLSVDLRVETADVVADVRRLPFPDGGVQEVLAHDVLEHFWRDAIPALLAEWNRVLGRGGVLRVRVPNLPVLAALIDTPHHDQIIENIYGGHRWGPDGAYDTHHWGWSRTSLARDLDRAGFVVTEIDNEPNMTALAVKR